MGRYTVVTRDVFVLGRGWYGQEMTYTYTLPQDILPTREAIQDYLGAHAGDFQSITDFAASIDEVEIPFGTEENEWRYTDITFREEE